MIRTSRVGFIKIRTVLFSSIVQVGDAGTLRPRVRALAVQRQAGGFDGSEGSFAAYPIFSRPIVPLAPRPDERISMQTVHRDPFITVGSVNILGVSASSIVQIGSNRSIDSEARVKHIRQLVELPSAGAASGASRP